VPKGKMSQFLWQTVDRKGARRMRLSHFFLAVLLLLFLSSVAQGACWGDALDTVDRDLLVMRSGAIYRILDDPAATALWLALSRITICDQTGNIGDEIVTYLEIRNEDANQMVRATRER
jgi:hypothetical protein